MPNIKKVYIMGWVALAVAITVGSLIPVEAVPKAAGLLSDKIQHGAAYFCLALLGWQAGVTFLQRVLILFLSLSLGIAIEFLQPLTGRHFEWADMIANTSGLLMAVLLCLIIKQIRTLKNRIKL